MAQTSPERSRASPAYRFSPSPRTYPATVMPSCSARATAISVGDVGERRPVNAARGVVVPGVAEQVVQPGRERLGLHLEGGAHAREEPRIDAESDPSPASRSEDALGGERHGPRQRHVGAPVHLRDGKTGDLVEARDHLLHPEVAQDEGLEIEGRAQEGEEALAVDVHGQRLLPDYLGLDFLEAAALELEVRPHRPYRATPVRKTKGPPVGGPRPSVRS